MTTGALPDPATATPAPVAAAAGPEARSEPRLPSLARVVAALVGRDLRRFFRAPSRVVGSLAQPLILWVVLGAGLGGSFRAPGAEGLGYLAYFYPGTVVLTILFTAIFATMSVIEDRHHGFLQAVLAAPVSRTALVLGKTLGGVAIAACQGVALTLLAPLAGFPLGAMDLPLVAGALALTALAFSALGFACAWWIDSTHGYHAVMSVALIPLWMLSGAMFPVTAGHGWIRALAAVDPMTYAVAAVRRGFHGGGAAAPLLPAWSSPLLDLTVTAAFAVAALALAVALCRRRG